MKITNSIVFAALLAAAGGANASALTTAPAVTITFDSPIFGGFESSPGPAHDNVFVTYPAFGGSLRTSHVSAGRFSGKATELVGVDPGIFVNGIDEVFMFCYELEEPIRGGQSVRYEINFDGAKTRTLDFLGAVNHVMNAGRDAFDPYAWARGLTGPQGSAIQLGIWESLYETVTAWSLAGGAFSATHVNKATSYWLDQFFAAIPLAASLDQRFAMTLENDGRQDMITADPPAAVPEPTSLALLGLGLAGLVASRRKRTA